MIVWDRGEWIPLEDWREGLEKGKLLFELRGYKLHGKWTLVKIKKSEKDWLLIKERDSYVKSPGDVSSTRRRCSPGLTVDEVKAGPQPGRRSARRRSRPAGAAAIASIPKTVEPMLAESAETAFTRDGWIFELKLDGYRLHRQQVARRGAAAHAQRQRLHGRLSRNRARDQRASVRRVHHRWRSRRASTRREAELLAAAATRATARRRRHQARRGRAAGDVLRVRPARVRGLRSAPAAARSREGASHDGVAEARRRSMRSTTSSAKARRFSRRSTTMGLEGIIAKKADAPYRGGPQRPLAQDQGARRRDDFVIVGFTSPREARSHLGALQLADFVNGELVYAGRVGTGFNDALLDELGAMLEPMIRETPPCGPPLGDGRSRRDDSRDEDDDVGRAGHTSCEVRFREWTPDGVLRHAAFLRMRYDKDPRECERQGTSRRCAGQRSPMPATRPEPNERAASPPSVRAAEAREDRSTSRISRRSTGRARDTRRATSSSTIARSRRGCCRICANRPLVHDAISRRDRRQVVLSEGRARVRAGRGSRRFRSGARTRSATSATSSATTSSRCSTSPTSARSRSTSGTAESARWSSRTGA